VGLEQQVDDPAKSWQECWNEVKVQIGKTFVICHFYAYFHICDVSARGFQDGRINKTWRDHSASESSYWDRRPMSLWHAVLSCRRIDRGVVCIFSESVFWQWVGMYVYVCVYTHTHTHCTWGNRMLAQSRDETFGEPEESSGTKCQDKNNRAKYTCIYIGWVAG